MLLLSQDYYDKPVLSLRTGGNVGTAHVPIINPNTLKIEGWFSSSRGEKDEYILPITEVREFTISGLIVDDHTALTLQDDIIRLRDIITLRFELLNKQVVSENGTKLGKVADFAIDDQTQYIKKLYVNPPLLKGFTTGQVMVDRSVIIEITNRKIVVEDATISDRSGSQVNAVA